MLRRALAAEQLALRRLQNALQHLAALRGFGIGDAHAGHVEALLGIPFCIVVADAQRRLRDEAQAAPFKIRPQLEDLGHCLERGAIALPRHNALVLVLNLRFAGFQLAQQHHDRLQQIQRLEAGDDDGLVLVDRDPFVGTAADDRRNVTGANEGIQAHIGRVENRADGRNDGDVVAENGEVGNAFSARARMSVSAVDGAVVSKPMAKNITCLSGFALASFSASDGE